MKVNFDQDTLNKLLETPAPMVCGIQARREELERIKSLEGMGKLEEIREWCFEGAPWLKHTEGLLPRKFSMK